MRTLRAESQASGAAEIVCPLSLRLGVVAAMLNFELPDHPVYDAGELLWFDDVEHGSGILAFLRRRENRRTDYYAEPALHLDTSDFFLGAGTGTWTVTEFTSRRLHVADDGVVADAVFTDVDERAVEIHIDDRDGEPHRRRDLRSFADGRHERGALVGHLRRRPAHRRGVARPPCR